MAEWFKAAVLKTAVGQLTVGSNPTLSASRYLFLRLKPPKRLLKRAT